MAPLDSIYEPIQNDLNKVEEQLRALSRVDTPWMVELLEYGLEGGGKRIRPALVLLSGKFYCYNLERLLAMATAIEILHIATLVHDDVIDHSPVRWGRPTVSKQWGESKALLLGDYLLSQAEDLAASTQNSHATRLLPKAMMTITTGEVEQSLNAFNLKQNRQLYLARIARKTATLISAATGAGAILSEAPQRAVSALKEYGYNVGMAFQIVDDILDFVGTEEELGKPVGSDLSEGTLTLPAMLLLEHYPEDNPIKRLFSGQDKEKNLRQAIEMVRNSPVIEECYRIASDYRDNAYHCLGLLPECASKHSLAALAEYVVSRRK